MKISYNWLQIYIVRNPRERPLAFGKTNRVIHAGKRHEYILCSKGFQIGGKVPIKAFEPCSNGAAAHSFELFFITKEASSTHKAAYAKAFLLLDMIPIFLY
jgi:hypothetical protein